VGLKPTLLMQEIQFFGDERQLGFCAHCGRETGTKDHVPSLMFLDEPHPAYIAGAGERDRVFISIRRRLAQWWPELASGRLPQPPTNGS
jgi:hypothetical protein